MPARRRGRTGRRTRWTCSGRWPSCAACWPAAVHSRGRGGARQIWWRWLQPPSEEDWGLGKKGKRRGRGRRQGQFGPNVLRNGGGK
uniref:Uncharacterized protein n=1 Tax=Setaria italica TaxID=4555 RepID=K3YF79_SETIT